MAGVEIRMADASRLKRATYRSWPRRARASPAAAWPATRRSAGSCRVLVLVFRPLREKLGLRRVRIALSGAAPIAPAGARVVLGARRAGARGLRADREHRAGHLHAGRRRAHRQGRQAAAGRRDAHRRRRRDPHPRGPASFLGYFKDPEAPRRRSTPTAGCTPATSASSTPTATSRSPTARRTSSSPRAARTSRRRRSRTSSRSRRSCARRSSSATAAST